MAIGTVELIVRRPATFALGPKLKISVTNCEICRSAPKVIVREATMLPALFRSVSVMLAALLLGLTIAIPEFRLDEPSELTTRALLVRTEPAHPVL